MLNSFFKGIFDTDMTAVIEPSDFLLCVFCSLLIGLFLAGCYMYHSKYSRSFVATIAMLPAVVCVIIMMVNGNVGTGVAVAGAFSLVRFRSAPGSAKEISAIFLAMTVGLLTGMGYLGYAVLTSVLFGLISMVYNQLDFGLHKKGAIYKTMHITIPEDLDYNEVFDSILREYTNEYEVVQVKTTNMGSLFRLTYDITLKDASMEKEMIDKLRIRNGNLEISVSRQSTSTGEL